MRFDLRGCLLWTIFAVFGIQSSYAETMIRVAVRNDAPPFSNLVNAHAADDLASYEGFVVDACREIFKRTNLLSRIKAIPVSAVERFKLLAEGRADILCGPTSVTKARLRANFFTYPIFLSGISVAIQTTGFSGTPKVGLISGTTALTGVETHHMQKLFGHYGTKISQSLELLNKGRKQEFLKTFISYADGFDALCDNSIDYFVGDIDIIANLATTVSKECKIVVSRRTVTREIYAIVFSRDFVENTPEGQGISIFMRAQSVVFEMFQDRTYHNIFKKNFSKRAQSRELKAFFNSYRRRVAQ